MKKTNLYLNIVIACTILLALAFYAPPLTATPKLQNTITQQFHGNEAHTPSNSTTTNNPTTSATPQQSGNEAEKPNNGIAPIVKPIDTEPTTQREEPQKQ